MHYAGVRGFLQVRIRVAEDLGGCVDDTHNQLSVPILIETFGSNVLKVRVLCQSLPYQVRYIARTEARLHHILIPCLLAATKTWLS
jgi:hypothetical protein